MTDRDIWQAVLEAIAADARIEANAIGVAVRDGVVTLTGRVSSFAEKTAAEQAAERTAGVKAIAQEIEVCEADESFCEDEVIAARIAQYLHWSASRSNDAVHVSVDSGWVTLAGTVDWAFQHAHLERFVRKLQGVTGVSNLIEARHPMNGERLCDLFRRTFHPHPKAGPRGLKVQ